MTFEQEILLAIIDTAILGGLILVVGIWLNRILERYKSDLAWKKKIAEARTQAYRELWALTKPIGGTGSEAPIEPTERKRISTALSNWYWDEGNGLYISHATVSVLMAGWKLLDGTETSPQQIRQHYTSVRKHLKLETGVYSEEEAQKKVR